MTASRAMPAAARLLVLPLFVMSLALGMAGTVLVSPSLLAASSSPSGASSIEIDLAVSGVALLFPLLGWVILRRDPRNRLGWVYLATGSFQALNLFATAYTLQSFEAQGSLPLASEISWLAVWTWVPGFTLFSTVGVLLFPTGRPPSARWWPVVWLAVAAGLLVIIPTGIATWPYRGLPLERAAALNVAPPGADSATVLGVIQACGQLGQLVAMVASVAGLVIRFGRARGVERAQLKWFTYGAVIEVVILLSWILVPLPIAAAVVTGVMFPLILPGTVGSAILRYRLYEIDRIISRTVSWALVSTMLLALFAGGVVGLQSILAPLTRENTIAVAGSTLLVATMFQTVRRRVQGVVDRRFNRARVDAGRSIDTFSRRLRGELDVDRTRSALVTAAATAMQPAAAALWLRPKRRKAA